MRTPSSSASVLTSDTRAMESECTSAARLRLTSEASCCALCSARGSNSSARNVCSQATMQPTSSRERKKKVRQKRLTPRCGRISSGAGAVSSAAGWVSNGTRESRVGTALMGEPPPCGLRCSWLGNDPVPGSRVAVWNEDVTDAPHGLQVARRSGIFFDQFAQARDLHVQAAVERLEFAATRQLCELFA